MCGVLRLIIVAVSSVVDVALVGLEHPTDLIHERLCFEGPWIAVDHGCFGVCLGPSIQAGIINSPHAFFNRCLRLEAQNLFRLITGGPALMVVRYVGLYVDW